MKYFGMLDVYLLILMEIQGIIAITLDIKYFFSLGNAKGIKQARILGILWIVLGIVFYILGKVFNLY